MRLRCIPKMNNENSNVEGDVTYISSGIPFASNFSQLFSQSYSNASTHFFASNAPEYPTGLQSETILWGFTGFKSSNYGYAVLNKRKAWTYSSEENCNFLLGLPLIFSISLDAEKFLSASKTFEKNVSEICSTVSKLILENNLSAIGEISTFQEEGTEPKLFITYGIANKTYSAILKLWDEVCKKVAETVPLEMLKKVTVVFDQI